MINIGFSFDVFIKDYINVFDIFVSYGFNPYFITSLSNKELINKEKEIYEKQTVFYHPSIIKQPEQLAKTLLDNKIFIILTSLPEMFDISNQSKHNFSILYFTQPLEGTPEISLTDKIVFTESPVNTPSKRSFSDGQSPSKGTLSNNEKTYFLDLKNPVQSTIIDYLYENNSCHFGYNVKDVRGITEPGTFIFNGSFGNTQQILTYYYTLPSLYKTSFKIYPSCNWQSSNDLLNSWIKFQPKSLKGIVDFTLNKQEADYHMVINASQEQLEPHKILYFAMEPYMDKSPQFSHYVNSLKSQQHNIPFIGEHSISINNNEWHLSPSIEDLRISIGLPPRKIYDKVLSVVVSTKNFDEGHILRLNFIRKLDDLSKEGKLPFELHVYGTKTDFHNYKGTLPPNKKDNGIFPYKYHFNSENNSIRNYVTEKFTDAIVGECLLFYWGCPNVNEYLGSNDQWGHVLSLKEQDFEKDLNTIVNAMNNNEWQQKIQTIKSVKSVILENFNLFRRLKTVIDLSKAFVFCLLDDSNQQNVNQYIQEVQKQSFKMCLFLNKKQLQNPGFGMRNLLLELMKHNKDFIFLHDVALIQNLHQTVSYKLMMHKDINAKFVGISSDTIQITSLDKSSFYVKLDFCELLAKQFLS